MSYFLLTMAWEIHGIAEISKKKLWEQNPPVCGAANGWGYAVLQFFDNWNLWASLKKEWYNNMIYYFRYEIFSRNTVLLKSCHFDTPKIMMLEICRSGCLVTFTCIFTAFDRRLDSQSSQTSTQMATTPWTAIERSATLDFSLSTLFPVNRSILLSSLPGG